MRTLFANSYVQMPDERAVHKIPLGETIYWLDKKGADIVAAQLGMHLGELTWRRRPRYSWIEHDLAVNAFYLTVLEACEASSDIMLHHWVPETEFLIQPDEVEFVDEGGKKQTRQIRPDGFFLLVRPRDDRPKPEGFAFLLEVDMATHSNPRFERNKVRAGLAYLESEAYAKRFDTRFGRWLVVTTGEQRLEHLLMRTEKAGGDGTFYLATFDQLAAAARISPSAVLTHPFWRVAGSRELTSLIPSAKVIAI